MNCFTPCATKPVTTPEAANDDRKVRIVTTRPKRGRFGEAPDAAEALDKPFSAFPSWFLRITGTG
jgi:hypothetical protein